jgi:hypothetical protein
MVPKISRVEVGLSKYQWPDVGWVECNETQQSNEIQQSMELAQPNPRKAQDKTDILLWNQQS